MSVRLLALEAHLEQQGEAFAPEEGEGQEEEAELEKLERWHERIRARDVCAAQDADDAEAALVRAREALERYSQAVLERTAS